MSPARLTSPPHGWEPLPMSSSVRGRQQQQASQQLASSFSAPDLVQLSGTSLFRQTDSSLTPVAWRRAVDSSDLFPEQEAPTPSMGTIAVRRLMPKNGGSLANSKAVAQSQALSELGNRAFIDTPLSRAPSASDCFLVGRPVTSPTSSKRNGGPSASQPSRLREPTPLEESGLPQAQSEIDLKALAEESVLWLNGMSKLERSAAIDDMKEWVKSAGLDLELWRQHFKQARQDSRAGTPKQQDRARAPRAFQTIAANDSSAFNPVPMQLKSYNDKLRSRSNISRAQVQSMTGHNAMAASPHTAALHKCGALGVTASSGDLSEGWNMARPKTDAEWHHLAVEALQWVQTKDKAERPAAMALMRQWVVQMGIHWDKWWGYCLKLNADKKSAERYERMYAAQEAGRPEREAAYQAACLTPCHSIQEDGNRDDEEAMLVERSSSKGSAPPEASRPSSSSADSPESQKTKAEGEKERKRRWAKDRKARDEAYVAQAAEWENNSPEKMVAGMKDQWKKNAKAYTDEIFEKN